MSKQAGDASAKLTMSSNSILINEQGWVLPVSLTCPEFVFEGKTVGVGITPADIRGDIARKLVTASFSPIDLDSSAKLEVKLHVEWSKKEQILRKWAEYRITGTDRPLLLKEIVLERLETPGQTATVTMKPGQFQSYPVFVQAFYTGIEFPVAAVRSENGRLLLAHRPGIYIQPNKWYESKKAIFGAAPVGQEKQNFKNYIAAHRTNPKGFHIDYNSWWTTKVPYSEEEILDLMHTFKVKMFEPCKECFDSFCIDMGWSEPKSFWDINTKLFPDKFTPIMKKAKEMKSNLGLWISPSNAYTPSSMDNEWAKDNGYETFPVDWHAGRLCCLGGNKYQTGFRDRLVEMVTKYGIRQIKFDGYNGQCQESNHGHAPGEYSAEAVAEGLIKSFVAIRQAAPDTWMETTCMTWNPSPWWLFYVDSVIGTYGDDSPAGRIPCPVYRESYTTARDYYNLQGAALLPIPVVAQEVLGIIHQTPEPFMDDAVTTIMRGHMFLPVYLNPLYMTDARWKTFAEILTWARKNESVLEETQPILPDSWQNGAVPEFEENAEMPREPYGYAHFKGNSGLVELRNPWITGCNYLLKLDEKLGLASDAKGLTVVSLYPEIRVYGQNLSPGQSLDVPLAPYETVVLSVAPNQLVKGIPSAVDALKGCGKVEIKQVEKTRVEFLDAKDYLPGGAKTAVKLNLGANVEVTAPSAELLVLVEGETPAVTPIGSIEVNGVEKKPMVTGSATGWTATQLPPHGHWTFLSVPLEKGENTIALDLYAGIGVYKMSAWVWAKKPGLTNVPNYKNALPEPEQISLQSVALVEPFDLNSVTVPVAKEDYPLHR